MASVVWCPIIQFLMKVVHFLFINEITTAEGKHCVSQDIVFSIVTALRT